MKANQTKTFDSTIKVNIYAIGYLIDTHGGVGGGGIEVDLPISKK